MKESREQYEENRDKPKKENFNEETEFDEKFEAKSVEKSEEKNGRNI